MRVLVLDDSEDRLESFRKMFGSKGFLGFHLTNNVSDCLSHLDSNTYDVIFLDHDIDEVSTGSHVVDWIIRKKNNEKARIIVHSLNPVGARYMIESLMRDGRDVHYIPFAWANPSVI